MSSRWMTHLQGDIPSKSTFALWERLPVKLWKGGGGFHCTGTNYDSFLEQVYPLLSAWADISHSSYTPTWVREPSFFCSFFTLSHIQLDAEVLCGCAVHCMLLLHIFEAHCWKKWNNNEILFCTVLSACFSIFFKVEVGSSLPYTSPIQCLMPPLTWEFPAFCCVVFLH